MTTHLAARAEATEDKLSISANASSGDSPAVRRLSKRNVNLSGTAQSEGVAKWQSEATRVPPPKNESSLKPI